MKPEIKIEGKKATIAYRGREIEIEYPARASEEDIRREVRKDTVAFVNEIDREISKSEREKNPQVPVISDGEIEHQPAENDSEKSVAAMMARVATISDRIEQIKLEISMVLKNLDNKGLVGLAWHLGIDPKTLTSMRDGKFGYLYVFEKVAKFISENPDFFSRHAQKSGA